MAVSQKGYAYTGTHDTHNTRNRLLYRILPCVGSATMALMGQTSRAMTDVRLAWAGGPPRRTDCVSTYGHFFLGVIWYEINLVVLEK